MKFKVGDIVYLTSHYDEKDEKETLEDMDDPPRKWITEKTKLKIYMINNNDYPYDICEVNNRSNCDCACEKELALFKIESWQALLTGK